MNKPWVTFLLLAAGAAPVALVAAWAFVRNPAERVPAIDEICALARAGEFDRAQSSLELHLLADPRGAQGHLLMAQFALDRPDPQPAMALHHLRAVRPENPEKAALVQFCMGKAHYQSSRYDLAERCWTEALRLNPTVPEAGWALLDLYELEGRMEDTHLLGLHLHEVEPDPRDKVRLLITLARLDIDKSAPSSQVNIFEPMVKHVPGDLHLSVALGSALIHDSRSEKGLTHLRDAVKTHSNSPEAWDALLTGLDDAGRPEELLQEFARLPSLMASAPRFARHLGQVEQVKHRWDAAVDAYKRALVYQPFNSVILYRLSRVLRLAGESAEVDRVNERLALYQTAFKQLRPVIDEALAFKTLGIEAHTDLYLRLADLREQMGRSDEARAWHRLVLKDFPDNKVSLAAIERLK